MNKLWRILNGRLYTANFYPKRWYWYGLSVRRYWGGRIVVISCGYLVICLDWRADVLKDMRTGTIK